MMNPADLPGAAVYQDAVIAHPTSSHDERLPSVREVPRLFVDHVAADRSFITYRSGRRSQLPRQRSINRSRPRWQGAATQPLDQTLAIAGRRQTNNDGDQARFGPIPNRLWRDLSS